MMSLKQVLGAALCCAFCQSAFPASAADTIETGLLGAANAVEWPFYIAIHNGFFTEAGIKPDVIYVPSPAGLVQQLASGSLDVCDIGVVEPIHAVARGAAVAILRISGAVSPYAIVAKADIKTLKDLKGRTFIIGGLVDINRVYLERVLQAAGLKDSEIDISVAGSTSARFAAIKSGAADATMLAPPVNFFAEAAGFHTIGMMIDYTKDMPFGSTDVARGYAEKNRDALLRFAGALDKAYAWFNNNANREAAIDILAAEMENAKRDDMGKSYDYLRKIGFFPTDGMVSKKRLEAVMDEMTAIGDTEGKVPIEKLVLAGVTRIGD
jgi:NitT/TauT family transport system substrate-binding protein